MKQILTCLVLFSTLSFTTAQTNNSLSFDGVDDYVETSLNDLSGSEITIEYWFKGSYLSSAIRQQGGGQYICSGYSYHHPDDPDHILSNDGGDGDPIKVGAASIDGSWHHIAMTWKQDTENGYRSFLDGDSIDARNSSNSPLPGITDNLLLGSYNGNGQFLNGILDEIRIWDYARSQEEIQSTMESELTGDETGLIAYWKLNTGDGTTIYDHSGNSNHGTIYGATWTTDVPPFQPQTTAELQTAVDMWVDDNATALATYGEINTWDVSLITNMSQLFYQKSTFNNDISAWDVSNVTDMSYMFRAATSFDQDLSTWNVSNVINMLDMFAYTDAFNQDISGWDVSSVTNMETMFRITNSFNQDISMWDVSNVTNFLFMFIGANALSEENQCAIHTSWSVQNDAWPYEWEEFCENLWCQPVIAAIQDTSMDEDSELVLQLSAESEEGYDTYFEAQSDTSSVYAYTEGDMLYINLMADWNGSSEITVLAYCEFDIDINDTATFTLTVNPVDDLPYVDGHIYPRDYPEDFGVDTVAYLPDVFTDIDGELTFSYSFTDSTVLVADVSSDHLVLSSLPDSSGETELMVTASNPARASVTDTVHISVWPINDAPVVSIPDTSMNEDSEFFYDLSDYITDVDSEDLSVSVNFVSAPMNENVLFQMVGPDTLRIFSRNDWFGTGNVRIRVYDGQIGTNDPFILTVEPVNDAPVFGDLFARVGVDMEFQVPVQVFDVDMDSLVVSFDDSWDYPDWLSLATDPYRLEGTAPAPGQFQFPLDLSDGDTSITDTFTLSAAFFHPRITSITDVPDDQGGRVYVSFLRSFFDQPGETNQMYTVFRRDVIENIPSWIVVGSGAAIGIQIYTYEVSTLRDSTADDDGMTEFKVVASMNEGHFHSPPQSGYSLDNIAPGVPEGLMATGTSEGVYVSWDISPEEDFQYFRLERSFGPEFIEFETFDMIDTSHTDTDYVLDQTNYYRLAAVDHAGNMSEYSGVVEATILSTHGDLIPDVYALHQNYPNPFNPVTTLRYDLPEDAMVNITIYDMMGRMVKTLVNSKQAAGYKSIKWNATSDRNEPVSAGLYLYTIDAGGFRETRKMVLLK